MVGTGTRSIALEVTPGSSPRLAEQQLFQEIERLADEPPGDRSGPADLRRLPLHAEGFDLDPELIPRRDRTPQLDLVDRPQDGQLARVFELAEQEDPGQLAAGDLVGDVPLGRHKLPRWRPIEVNGGYPTCPKCPF